jgi:hypothetical protein
VKKSLGFSVTYATLLLLLLLGACTMGGISGCCAMPEVTL